MIEIEHVARAFGQDAGDRYLPVLEDVDVAIRDGTFVSIVGPSGCGKTTLLRIVHGLLQPTGGRVSVDGAVVRGPDRDRAVVFQDANLLPWRTVRNNVELGLEIRGVPRAERAERASRALDAVGLGAFASYYPHQLSGGMRQLVGLARALAGEPRYLLMDEPFASLDLQLRELMQVHLLDVWERDRKTVLFVTHSIDEAIFLSDRVVVLSARPGRVLDVVDVRLPRPRSQDSEEIKHSQEFLAYRQRIRQLLHRELVSARAASADSAVAPAAVLDGSEGAAFPWPRARQASSRPGFKLGPLHWRRPIGSTQQTAPSRGGKPWR